MTGEGEGEGCEPRRVLGGYRLLRALGRGGMGIVYEAEDQRTGRAVAVKTVFAPDEKQLASIRREIGALSRLRHPGVVRILAQSMAEGPAWYATT